MVAVGMRKLLLAVVVVLVAVTGAFVVAGVAFDRTTVERHAIAGGAISAIVVTSEAGDVQLVPAGTRMEIRETQHYVITKPRFEQTTDGGVLTIKSSCDTKVLTCYADLQVTVPPRAAVTVEAASGDVEATGIGVRDARLHSDSGDVHLEPTGRQQLDSAQTDSGDVDVVAAAAREIEARSDSGDVSVDARSSPLRVVARSDSGDVTVTVPRGAYAVDAKAGSGDVKVEGLAIDETAPNSIEARTDSGEVSVRAR
jgi:DUF4097 and DUF4098 domain-containing protein YvlB